MEKTVKCDSCGKEFKKNHTEIGRKKKNRERSTRNFCSRDCYGLSKTKERAKMACAYCGKEIIALKSKKKYKKAFCDYKCQKSSLKKEREDRRNELVGKEIGRCRVIEVESIVGYTTHYLMECACGERFTARCKEIRKGFVYECPNCVFRRSQQYIGGKKFGRLSVQDKWEWRISEANGKRFRYWYCVCECGEKRWIQGGSILRGHTTSCGCWVQKNNSRYVNETLYPKRHGMSGKHRDLTYARWTVLVSKCYNPKYYTYHNWGGDGYTVCDAWRNDYHSFHDWIIKEGFKKNLTVEIKEGCKEFSPKNCRLADFAEHANKMRKITQLKKYGIDYCGERKTLTDWAKALDIPYQTLSKRWRECKDLEKCLTDEWKDGSGCHAKRHDVKDEDILRLYNDGYTIVEIQEELNCSCAYYRLKKMGAKMRRRSKRSFTYKDREILKLLKEKASFYEILKKGFYASKVTLKAKLQSMGVSLKVYEIIY